jgi:hypothetical protein
MSVANEVFEISKAQSIPLEDLADHIKQRQEEKQRLEEEIKQTRAILESLNVDYDSFAS